MFDTVADVLTSLDVPPERIRMKPSPGTATVRDVLRIEAKEGVLCVLCELANGTLVEKPMVFRESGVGMKIGILIGMYLESNNIGMIAGESGAVRLFRYRVRIPDVGFYGWHHFPNRTVPEKGIPRVFPDLAVDVISPGNTRKEMALKLSEYFKAGTKLVWYVYPKTKTIDVYTSPTDMKTLTVKETLTGGDVLPGFKAKVAKVFA